MSTSLILWFEVDIAVVYLIYDTSQPNAGELTRYELDNLP